MVWERFYTVYLKMKFIKKRYLKGSNNELESFIGEIKMKLNSFDIYILLDKYQHLTVF